MNKCENFRTSVKVLQSFVIKEAFVLSIIFSTFAEIANHEADHVYDDLTNTKAHSSRRAIKDKDYTNQEEKRVITGSEQLSAFANGEIKRGQVTRTNHRGKTVLTVGATSNIIDDYATTYYEKKNISRSY